MVATDELRKEHEAILEVLGGLEEKAGALEAGKTAERFILLQPAMDRRPSIC